MQNGKPLNGGADGNREDGASSRSTARPAVKYCLITCVRNEAEYLPATIESVLQQTVLPLEWVMVDDGSTDSSGAIIDNYAAKYPWIRALHRKDRGHRAKGGGVEAFLEATTLIARGEWDFLVNLDGDLTFEPEYFQGCFDRFQNAPRLGIGGGTILEKLEGGLKPDNAPSFHVRGGAKIYRKECWEQLGGLICSLGWDTVDELKANQLGWATRTFPDLFLVHHRMSGAVWGEWGKALNEGESDFIVAYHPLFFAAKCVRHLAVWPYLIRSVGIVCGYVRAAAQGMPRLQDQELRKYLRTQQLRRLFGQSTIWK